MGVPLNGWPFSGTFSTVSLHRYSEHFLINDLKSETSGRSFPSDVLSDLTCSNPANLLHMNRKVSALLKPNTLVAERRRKAEP